MILTLSFGGAKRICSLTVTSGLLLFNLNCGEMKETRSFGHYHCNAFKVQVILFEIDCAIYLHIFT